VASGALQLTRTDNDLLAFTALAAFGLGLVLYLLVMTMVFLRWTFQPLDPAEADPPAWIGQELWPSPSWPAPTSSSPADVTAPRARRPLQRRRG
jgi:hypothetical protein